MSEQSDPHTKDLTVVEPKPLAVAEESPLATLARLAADPNCDVDKMERIIAVIERREAAKAEADFNEAFAKFKATCPKIVRRTRDDNPQMSVTEAGGRKRKRMYAALEDISAVVDPYLSPVGLSYDWDDAVVTPDGYLTRNAVLRHKGGHSRSACSPPMPIEGTEAWKKLTDRGESGANPMQRAGIADMYAKRYAISAVMGLTTVDDDDDGNLPGGGQDAPTITGEQYKDLNDLYLEAKPDERVFFKYFSIKKLSELRVADYEEAMGMLKVRADEEKQK